MKVRAVLAIVLIAAACPALASPRLTFSIAQLKEVVEARNGSRTTRMVPALSASPGDVVEYVLSYENRGDEVATDAVIEDPIPKGTTYLANSAVGDGAQVTFSNDGGKTFAHPVKLTYEMRLPSGAVERRVATPAEYTHIRWTLARVPPGGTGTVAFRVKVN